LEDAADLAAADGDALGLGRGGQRVQGPLRRLVGLLGPVQAKGAVGLAAQPPGRVASGQGDDAPAVQLPKPPRAARAGQVSQAVQAAGVEAVQPAVDGALVAAELGGDLAHLGAVPAQRDDARALQPARRRVAGMSEPADAALLGGVGGWAGKQRRQHGSLLRHKVRNAPREPSSYIGLKERSIRVVWSPEQIAGWLPLAYPDDPTMRISHETIYLSLYVQRRQALRGDLRRCLRTGRAMRHPRGKRLPQGRGQLLDTIPISQRPAEADQRTVPGHWEGDLVLGKRPSAVLTLVERTSRSVLLVALPAGWRAEQVRPALTAAMERLPRRLRRSLTWDHGKEMAEHARFTADTGIPVYFCDPRSPWQRASNENANGLLRQYLPRTADLRQFGQADLDRIATELNGRPRQILGFQTPSCVFEEALR
jgi:IS30 family transposase